MITNQEIIKYNEKNKLYHETNMLSEQIFTYSTNYAHQKGLTDVVYNNSFASLCSGIVGGLFISVGSEYYFKDTMEYDAVDLVGLEFNTDEEKIHAIKELYGWFKSNAKKYEKTIFQHGCRLPMQYYTQLDSIDKPNLTEKIRFLLTNHAPEVQKIKNSHEKKRINWKFTYTEEKSWQNTPGETDLEKLVNLL